MDPELLVKVMTYRGLGFDQTEIAQRTGSSQQTVSKYLAFVEATARGILAEGRLPDCMGLCFESGRGHVGHCPHAPQATKGGEP